MKTKTLPFLILISFMFTSCQSHYATLTLTSLPTVTQSVPTSIVLPTQTFTLTPSTTLVPEKAKEKISDFLQKPNNCIIPCFWGIMPDKTSIGEAKNIFTHLGLQVNNFRNSHGWEFYAIEYEFEDRVSIRTVLEVQEELVKGLVININPEPELQMPNISREWLAYSPETLIKQYGNPTYVEFYLSMGPSDGTTLYILDYGMTIYFDGYDLTVQYHSEKIKDEEIIKICPLIDQYQSIRVWLGKNPANEPRKQDMSLENATHLNLENFTSLMLQESEKACLNVSRDAFFP